VVCLYNDRQQFPGTIACVHCRCRSISIERYPTCLYSTSRRISFLATLLESISLLKKRKVSYCGHIRVRYLRLFNIHLASKASIFNKHTGNSILWNMVDGLPSVARFRSHQQLGDSRNLGAVKSNIHLFSY
jgi:hypothetical protein